MQQKVFSDWFLALPLVIDIFAQVHKCETVECTLNSLDTFISILGVSGYVLKKSPVLHVKAKSVDSDQTPHIAASDQRLHCLPISLLRDARNKWVNLYYSPGNFR